MNAPAYTPEILRLTTSLALDSRLAEPMASAERRSPVCGSRITVDVRLDEQGRVSEAGMLVRACAFGQASAALLDAGIVGRSAEDLAAVRDGFAAWLSGAANAPPAWPDLELLAPALRHKGRHAAMLLPFEAAAEAAALAGKQG
jgi:NifU-like protein involved in Fe-S cluster formation